LPEEHERYRGRRHPPARHPQPSRKTERFWPWNAFHGRKRCKLQTPGGAARRARSADAARRTRSPATPRRTRSSDAALLLLLLLLALAAPPTAHARRLPGEQVAAHLVSVAQREWRDWGGTLVDATDGIARLERAGANELDTAPFDAQARVHRYWALGTGTVREPGAAPRPNAPWSAAFISFLMQQVGVVAPSFVGNAAHARYLRALLTHEREAGDVAQFVLLLADEAPVKPGDLLCGPRNISRLRDRVTLLRMESIDDLEYLSSAHCDIVVGIDRRRHVARVVGGNVFDSVAMTRLPLTADGRLIRTLARPWFLIVRAR
jgi:hypothetical protein